MMGSNDKPQDELFYAFNLDEIIPQDHLLRDIDRVLDLSNLREHLEFAHLPMEAGKVRAAWQYEGSLSDKFQFIPDDATRH